MYSRGAIRSDEFDDSASVAAPGCSSTAVGVRVPANAGGRVVAIDIFAKLGDIKGESLDEYWDLALNGVTLSQAIRTGAEPGARWYRVRARAFNAPGQRQPLLAWQINDISKERAELASSLAGHEENWLALSAEYEQGIAD